ncbi:MAG: hypothetical protein N4A74_26075 [Carboxylicivirga sp.]|jgi:hypothetical protein|nr:hypothetical protein [Carboxylicivirga sp.]
MTYTLNKALNSLKLKKQFSRTPDEFEIKKLESAYLKIFKPTLESIKEFCSGGDFDICLCYQDLDGNNQVQHFSIKIFTNDAPVLNFRISLPNILNVGSVEEEESYGLTKKLIIEGRGKTMVVPENSIKDFKTVFPSKPQILEGKFKRVITSINNETTSYCRLIVLTNDTKMIYPTSILEYGDNHMKFDDSNLDRQSSLLGIPFMSTKGMYVELKVKGCDFHFYGLESLNSIVIDSLDEISVSGFKMISYAIRLCFAFLCGKFYKSETFIVTSGYSDFSKITYVDYQADEPSIITENQIINPTFFFSQYSRKDKEVQKKWERYHKMFDTKIFSLMCEKTLESPEFMRSIELIINAGHIKEPIQKGALYSVCIETITELVKSDNEDYFKPIPEKSLWKQFHEDIKTSLDKIKKDISEDGYNILKAKIDNLNGPTNRDKLVKSFKIVGIDLSQRELGVLEHRNSYLHGGHPDDDSWATQSNINALDLHYIISWLILKYFHYSGHYINISGWYILHDFETSKIMESLDFSELGGIIKKVKEKDFESKAQLAEAKQILENFDKFNKAAQNLEELIKII